MQLRKSNVRGTFRKVRLYAEFAAAFAAFTPGMAFAQSNAGGYIYGVAEEGAGEVTVRSLETGATRSVLTDQEGRFRVDPLTVGEYEVIYKKDGVTRTEQVSVSLNQGAQVRFEAVEEVVVTGVVARALVDTQSTETSTNFSAAELRRFPVQRTISSVQLLAPDAVQGSNDFETQQGHALVSFGGSSPLENAYYLNGFNITDFRKGLGGAEVPFEFYKDINIRTGGYSAEFGRSIGGSVSAVSKTGTNTFKAGGNVFWEPDFGRETYPDVFLPGGEPLYINRDDERDAYEANIFASGPIIKDKLFFYALVGKPYLKRYDLSSGAGSAVEEKSDGPEFWAGNILYNIADGHQLQFTAFSDERDYTTSSRSYDYETGQSTSTPYDGVTEQTYGGQNYILNYNGQFTDWFGLGLLYGHGERQEIVSAVSAGGTPCSLIRDRRGDTIGNLGCLPALSQVPDITDTRDAYRIDAIFDFELAGTHQLKVGYEREDLETDYYNAYAGDGTVYTYDTCTPDEGDTTCTVGGVDVPIGAEYVTLRNNVSSGVFENKLTAFYVQDRWQVTDQLLLDVGVRYDEFDLTDATGASYLKLDDNWGPRLGIAYDVFADGRAKLYANYGKYFLPIETNLAARALAIGEDRTTNYSYTAIDEAGFPVGLEQIGTSAVDVGEGDQAYDQNMKATEQDEYILGFDMQLVPLWTVGIKGVHRKLIEAQEDTCYFDENGEYGCVLLNPGSDPFIDGQDYNFDGTPDTLTLSNDDLLLPEAERKYYAVQLNLDRQWDGKWFANFSYTWSHLYGNFEGFANSDQGQVDPGITIGFDNFALVSYGDLPNDRRHNFKLRGGYQAASEWLFSGAFQLTSGRPKNRFGVIPGGTPGFSDDPDFNEFLIGLYNEFYEGEFSYVNGQRTGRGSAGRLDWTMTLDLAVAYSPRYVKGLTVGLDVFNVTNEDRVTNIEEIAELRSGANPQSGLPRLADSFQTPRTFRLSARYEFGGPDS